ncbi:MAG: hypothetical protein RW306_18625 [Geobacteraceae bacterium]|nr:hypothetical protein [Geobacteraceae bacterium]
MGDPRGFSLTNRIHLIQEQKFKQAAAVYINRKGDTAILVTLHYNGVGGFLFEDQTPKIVAISDCVEDLGACLRSALVATEVRPAKSFADHNPSDWPAFKSSGLRTIRKFESEFIRLSVEGANGANISCRIEGEPAINSELKVTTSANPCLPRQLGEKCLLVWRACRDKSLE